MEDRLPSVLRTSKLPWSPDQEEQSPAPAPDDSWSALTGTLEWTLCAHQDAPNQSPTFVLGLRNIADQEGVPLFLHTFPSLPDAVAAADLAYHEILQQLRQHLLPK